MRLVPTLAILATTLLLDACAAPASAPGPGRGPMMGGPRVGSDYTPGWMMMTPEERDEHHRRMLSVRTPEECRQLLEEHRKLMTERARARGMGAMPGPRRDACAAAGS